VILGAEVLHPKEEAPSQSEILTAQREFLTRIHDSLLYLYEAGVFMAFFGTILGAFEIYTRTAHECLRAVVPRLQRLEVRRARPWVLAYSGSGALALLWSEFDPVEIVTPAAILGAVLSCGLWCLAEVYAERWVFPAPYRMRRWFKVLVVLAGLFLTAAGVVAAVQYAARFF
jgi:hypothetical protein